MKSDENLNNHIGQSPGYNHADAECPFCNLDKSKFETEDQFSYVTPDLYPVTRLHMLVIPKRHVADFFGLYQTEISSIYGLLQATRINIQGMDNTVTGFNVGTNAGTDAGQSVSHAHIHLIPRRDGDTSLTVNNPKGGVRWAVPTQRT